MVIVRICGYNIQLTGKSNFPRIEQMQESCIANRTRSKSNVSMYDITGTLSVVTGYFKKIVMVDATTPNLVTKKRNSVKVDVGSVEVWAARVSAVIAAVQFVSEYV